MHDTHATDPQGTARRNLVVYVASETLGRGDEALGHTLMAAFLDTLAQLDERVTHAIFINGGARLTMEGSPVLAQIGQLEELGAAVLTCGTCLSHFGSKDQLAVGSVSNMFAILQILAAADRIIRS
jgi:selenium metabolism protein YedF